MLQFCKRLKSKGIARITLVFIKSFLKTLQDFPPSSFPMESITDGFDDGIDLKLLTEDIAVRICETSSESLGQLLEKLRSSGSSADCLIYDGLCPWALDVAKKFGLTAAAFFTQSNSINSIFFHTYKGEVKVPLQDIEIQLPGGLPVLKPQDMPSFFRNYESERLQLGAALKQFVNVQMADCILVNTFNQLEECEWMANYMTPVWPIGPTIPSAYTDKRIPDDKEYGLCAFKPVTDPCISWLDIHAVGSVIYVSFGSFAQPRVEQFEELALALKTTEMNFLWVVRATEESKLPENFRQETSGKGLIVTWCNQLDVLAHEAVGCFVTHCGWNSTLEALNSGVPMVAVPQWSDQFTNAKFVADVWKVGIRAEEDEKGIVRKEELMRCVIHVTEGGTGEDIKRSAEKWKKMAREAVDDGGSSDKNIQEFVSVLFGR